MKRKITINVTAEDIAQGKRYRSSDCPVALAVKRAIADPFYNVIVNQLNIKIYGENGECESVFKNTYEIYGFVNYFDNKEKEVHPFGFDIEIEI